MCRVVSTLLICLLLTVPGFATTVAPLSFQQLVNESAAVGCKDCRASGRILTGPPGEVVKRLSARCELRCAMSIYRRPLTKEEGSRCSPRRPGEPRQIVEAIEDHVQPPGPGNALDHEESPAVDAHIVVGGRLRDAELIGAIE